MEQKHENKLSVVLPCFNPPEGWEKVVVSSIQSLERLIGEEIELVIVNDGSKKNVSPDQIAFIQQELTSVRIVEYQLNCGKGQALRTGVKHTSGAIIIFTDIDFPYTEESFISIYTALKNGSEVALGHRNKAYYQHTPASRKWISKSLRFSLKTFLRLPTDDSQCGIKGFRSKGKEIFLQTSIDRFLFDLEFIKLISKRKIKSENVEVELKPGVVFSKVNLAILGKESLNFMRILFKR